jgi:SAM-dependent methyltransferase
MTVSNDVRTGQKDFLWSNLTGLPYFRALLRAVEANFYQDLPIVSPVLDLGCGDGDFAARTFSQRVDVGIDPWLKELRQAAETGVYQLILQGDGGSMPFPGDAFSTVISNSVLEHIPHVDEVVAEAARVLKPGGRFIFCVPNQRFTENLSISRFLERVKLKGAAAAYRRWFNRISRHRHCDSQEHWKERLAANGFVVDQAWDYFSPQALGVLEWGHYFGLPALISKKLTGRWVLAPTRWNLGWLARTLQPYYSEARVQPQGSYTFYVTHKPE